MEGAYLMILVSFHYAAVQFYAILCEELAESTAKAASQRSLDDGNAGTR